jgi:Zn-dependent peptidase ImmA (M78 family)
MEREANQFAAELLMPPEVCAALITHFLSRYGSRRDVLAKRLATELLVSQTAMLNRLKYLRLPDYLIPS